MPTIAFKTFIAAPPERVFALNLDVDAHAAAFADSRERAVGGVLHGQMRLGDTVTWEAVHFGVRQHLTSQITRYAPPNSFRDEMVRGAFHSFQHDHTFTAIEDGTLMEDRFVYVAPLGPFGWLANRLFLRAYVARLLQQRAAHLKRLAENAPTAGEG